MVTVSSRRIAGEGTSAGDWAGWPGFAGMPRVEAQALAPGRAVIVAPHPDDEVLGCGGLIQALVALGRPPLLVAVTDGGASHPGSSRWPAARLLARRPEESREALRRLGVPEPDMRRLGLPDGGVTDHEHALLERLVTLLRPGDSVFATWEYDGHPDHEATGRAALGACRAVGARCLWVPVWTWHWAVPGDSRVPWARARRLALTAEQLACKRRAMAAFASQTEADPSTGAGPILTKNALERLFHPWETFLT